MPVATRYWTSGVTLLPGSTVGPGNWGRIVRQRGLGHPAAARELQFEVARLATNPQLPSRLDAAFLSPSEGQARAFRFGSRPTDCVFEVEILQPDAPLAIVDMAWLDRCNAAHGASDQGWQELGAAINYWQGCAETEPLAEILTLSPIKVLNRVV